MRKHLPQEICWTFQNPNQVNRKNHEIKLIFNSLLLSPPPVYLSPLLNEKESWSKMSHRKSALLRSKTLTLAILDGIDHKYLVYGTIKEENKHKMEFKLWNTYMNH